MRTKLTILFLCTLFATPFASAQLTLNDFSAFESPNTFFAGDWELTGDIAGTHLPRSSFAQGAGFYTFADGSNSDSAAAIYFFDSPINITGYSLLQVSARLFSGNTAPTLTIALFDSLGASAFAVMSTAAFAGPSFTVLSTPLTYSPGFDASDLTSFQLSGSVVGGNQTLSISLDHLSVAAPTVTSPVPESSAYGALSAAFIATLVIARRLRK